MAVVLDARVVEVGQIAAVVDDSLCVRVREADARERRELEGRLAVGRSPQIHGRHPSPARGLCFRCKSGNLPADSTGNPLGEGTHEARGLSWVCVLAGVLLLSGAAPGAGKQEPARTRHVSGDGVARQSTATSRAKGLDIADQKAVGDQVQLDLVLTRRPGQGAFRARRRREADPQQEGPDRSPDGGGAGGRAASPSGGDYDGPDGFVRTSTRSPATTRNSRSSKSSATRVQGREIIAIKLTQGARDEVDGSRPAVLFSATQHAREWIAPEIDMRILEWYIARWRRERQGRSRSCSKDASCGSSRSMNPDGYQYTFQSPDTRLWRKNLRDNNGERDDRGRRRRRPEPQLPGALELRRARARQRSHRATPTAGPSAGSEPETQAMMGLFDRSSSRSRSTSTRSGRGCSTRRAGRSVRRRRTTRSTTRSRGTSPTRRSRTSTRASRRTCST